MWRSRCRYTNIKKVNNYLFSNPFWYYIITTYFKTPKLQKFDLHCNYETLSPPLESSMESDYAWREWRVDRTRVLANRPKADSITAPIMYWLKWNWHICYLENRFCEVPRPELCRGLLGGRSFALSDICSCVTQKCIGKDFFLSCCVLFSKGTLKLLKKD